VRKPEPLLDALGDFFEQACIGASATRPKNGL
jgi:hypothetical protein